MTAEEAAAVIEVMLQADGGCATCANALLRKFVARFPEHGQAAMAAFEHEFYRELELDT